MGRILTVIGVIATLIVSRQIVRPLNYLTDEVSKIPGVASGTILWTKLHSIHPEKIPATTEEIQKLQIAFSKMKRFLIHGWTQLNEYHTILEQKVEDPNQRVGKSTGAGKRIS